MQVRRRGPRRIGVGSRALTLAQPAQRIAFEEYVQAVSESSERVQRLTRAMEQQLEQWRWRPVVNALQACRGIQLIHAMRMVAELGDLSRFSHPRQLMGYLGLIPSEDSSGEHRHQGAITKAGNSSARRALVEAAWAYRNAAAVSPSIARRQTDLPKTAIEIAWKAQLRLCARFRKLARAGAEPQQDRGRHRPRVGGLCVGDRPPGQTALNRAQPNL